MTRVIVYLSKSVPENLLGRQDQLFRLITTSISGILGVIFQKIDVVISRGVSLDM